jgi:hypothetical protein
MTISGQVGFSQRIQLPWLEQTTNLILAGNSRSEIKTNLHELLSEQLSGGKTTSRGSLEKTISILFKTWLVGRPEWPFIREKGLDLLRELPVRQHLPIHWGMTMAVYPFFGAVAETTGRLLQLQDTVGASQVQRRLKERYGERETVSRSVRRILRVFSDWGVLEDTQTRGMYRSKGEKQQIHNEVMNIWLIVARLATIGGGSESFQTIIQHPSFFPFQINKPSLQLLKEWHELNVSQYGFGDDNLVSLFEIT